MKWIGAFAIATGITCGAIVIPASLPVQYAVAVATMTLAIAPAIYIPAYALSRVSDPEQAKWSSWGAAILIAAACIGMAINAA